MRAFFALLTEALTNKVRIVAHNASFDLSRLAATAAAHGGLPVLPVDKTKVLCTMQTSKKACGLLDVRQDPRYLKPPKLEELHEHLFHSKPVGTLHEALADVRVLIRCYVEGAKRGLWPL